MMAKEQPRLLVVAGPNGAGKTTVTERGLAHTCGVRPGTDWGDPD
jgi:uridine kinase